MGLWDHNRPYMDPLAFPRGKRGLGETLLDQVLKYNPPGFFPARGFYGPYAGIDISQVLDQFEEECQIGIITGKQMNISEKLDFYIKNNLNVLLVGEAGTGKTALVTKAFKENNLNWLYFSASTMDPWVDFIGIPKESVSKDGVKYLDLVRPKAFAEDTVEAIFLDEYNRANKKVRNSVMELIQFKSINGKKFENLKIVWVAINPWDEEDTYDVERLDPAQEDRFHIKLFMENKPDFKYFSDKFGNDNASAAIEWWKQLYKSNSKITPSPRRLDYALEVWQMGGDINDVLDKATNPKTLLTLLKEGTIDKQIDKIVALTDSKEKNTQVKKLLNQSASYDRAIEYLLLPGSKDKLLSLLEFIDNETITKIVNETKGNLGTKFTDILITNLIPVSTMVLNYLGTIKLSNDLIKKKIAAEVLARSADGKAFELIQTSKQVILSVDNLSWQAQADKEFKYGYQKEDIYGSLINLKNSGTGFDGKIDNKYIVTILNNLTEIIVSSQKSTLIEKYKDIVYLFNWILYIANNNSKLNQVMSGLNQLSTQSSIDEVNERLKKYDLISLNVKTNQLANALNTNNISN